MNVQSNNSDKVGGCNTSDDIDEIVESHLKHGKRVDRLVMLLGRR
jgi:hypothetical protein